MTISPYYHQRGMFNPFYILKINSEVDVRPAVNVKGEIKYKNVEQGKGTLVKRYGRGKYIFQIVVDDRETDFYVVLPRNLVAAHYGMKTRKNSTASSNVNEFLTVYFLKHPRYKDPQSFQNEISVKTGPTGVLNGDGQNVSYEDLVKLIDQDETADRDIEIGYQNSLVVAKDLRQKRISKVYWVPRGKPAGISDNNPSDVIVKFNDGKFFGYSNKVARGKDTTPKFNTNLAAFYSKLNNPTQLNKIKNFIDKAWDDAAKTIPRSKVNAYYAINNFNIKKEKFGESSSRNAFAKLAQEFVKDGLKFYREDFYWKFRNNLINLVGNHLTESKNLMYFLNTVGYYTYDDPKATPCPYKLLIGSPKRSSLKEITTDDTFREMLFESDHKQFRQIEFIYRDGQQSFNLRFQYHFKGYSLQVEVPLISRTRSSGGWSGKSLFINSPGIIKE